MRVHHWLYQLLQHGARSLSGERISWRWILAEWVDTIAYDSHQVSPSHSTGYLPSESMPWTGTLNHFTRWAIIMTKDPVQVSLHPDTGSLPGDIIYAFCMDYLWNDLAFMCSCAISNLESLSVCCYDLSIPWPLVWMDIMRFFMYDIW